MRMSEKDTVCQPYVGYGLGLFNAGRRRFQAAASRARGLFYQLCEGGAKGATGPASVIVGGAVAGSTGAGRSGLSSSRNLSSMPWIEVLASSGPVSRMSLCWNEVRTTVIPAFSQISSSGTTPGSGLKTESFERNDRILNRPSVMNGTRRLSSVTTFLIRSEWRLAKYIEISPPLE